MKSFYKYLLLSFVLILSLTLVIKQNKKALNYLAKIYFDKEYYITNYPEVKSQSIKPFEHYITKGWYERKNPSKNFNTDFYLNYYNNREYLANNKSNPIADCIKQILTLKKCYSYPLSIPKSDLLKHPKYYLALVAFFQNEARFLKEWIEFYRLMGVEHFYLYNHLSTDNYMEVLEPYIKNGIVDIINITTSTVTIEDWNKVQVSGYSDKAKELASDVEWLIVVDTDEFMFPVNGNNLVDLLKKYDKCPTLSVNWVMFGNTDVQKIDNNSLLIEKLIKSNSKHPDLHVKSIVKPRYVKKFTNPHFPVLQKRYAQCSENYEYFIGHLLPKQSINLIRINHYWSRDLEFFIENKLNRTHITHKDWNEEQIKKKKQAAIDYNKSLDKYTDNSILKFVPALKKTLFKN